MKLRDYILKRLILLIPVMFGVSFFTFFLSYYVGDPITSYLGQNAERFTPQQVERYKKLLGLDKPWWEQYIRYVSRLLQGDWGTSVTEQSKPVLSVIAERFPATAELAIAAMILALLVGIPLGIISAIRKDKPIDHFSRIMALSGVSIPVFWLGLIVQLIIFNINISGILPFYIPRHFRYDSIRYDLPDRILFGLFPATNFILIDSLLTFDLGLFWDALAHLLLPAFVLSWIQIAIITRMTRMAMLETLRQDFILLAKAKGLRERVIIYRHALRNAIIPTLTIAGLALAGLLTGAVLTETVFDWPGLGSWVVDAIASLDQASIQGFVLLASVIYVLSNLAVDILYAFIDPRIRYD